MLTLWFDCSSTLLKLALGLLALSIARSGTHTSPQRRAAWRLTGMAFTVSGTLLLLQTVFQVWAVLAGAGTPVYQGYIRWAPAANHSRDALMLCYGLLLLRLTLRPELPAPAWRRSGALLGAAAMLGAALGGWQGEFIPSRHMSSVAVVNSVELILLLSALLLALLRRAMDLHLWVCVVLYCARGAVHTVWVSALASFGVAGAWTPAPWGLALSLVVAYLSIDLVAVHRLLLARRGVPVGALLDRLEPTGAPALH